MNAATAEPVNWIGLLFVIAFSVWAVVLIGELVVGTILLFKVYKLTLKMGIDAVQAAEDRLVTRQLLTVVKGWALVMESKESRKEEQIKQVAKSAEKSTEEVKAAVLQIPDQVKAILAETSQSNPNMPIVRPPEPTGG